MNYNGSLLSRSCTASCQCLPFSVDAENFYLPIDVTLDHFDRLVTLLMLYKCEVWVFEKIDVLGKLQLKFLKCILKVKMTACSSMAYGELDRYLLSVSQKKNHWILVEVAGR